MALRDRLGPALTHSCQAAGTTPVTGRGTTRQPTGTLPAAPDGQPWPLGAVRSPHGPTCDRPSGAQSPFLTRAFTKRFGAGDSWGEHRAGGLHPALTPPCRPQHE